MSKPKKRKASGPGRARTVVDGSAVATNLEAPDGINDQYKSRLRTFRVEGVDLDLGLIREISGQLRSVALLPDGKLSIGASLRIAAGVGSTAAATFDPWTSTGQDALTYPGGTESPEFASWAIAHALLCKRTEIESDGITALQAVQLVLVHGLRAPLWLTKAFSSRLSRFERYEVSTLDEAFNHKPLDPRTRKTRERDRRMLVEVHQALMLAVENDPNQPIHGGYPFEDVGRRFGIGKTKVYDLYRRAVDEEGLQDIGELRRVLLEIQRRKGEGPSK